MPKKNATTLVMLLSMAKLQSSNQLAEGVLQKRWQTPEETLQQTQEALAHIQSDGRNVDRVVMLYTDTLYLNNDSPAMGLYEKYQNQTFEHREKLDRLLDESNVNVPVVTMLWNELVQAQPNYQQPRHKLKDSYKKKDIFRTAVQQDNTRRGEQAGDALLPSDMFVMEETGLFDGLVRGYLKSEKIATDSDIVIGYPGPVLESLKVAQTSPLRIYNGKPVAAKEKPRRGSWLDLSAKDKPQEEELYSYTPDARVIASAKKQERKNFLRTAMKVAASFVLPIAAAATWYATRPAPQDKTEVAAGDYEAIVTQIHFEHREQPDTLRVRYVRDGKGWLAEAFSANNAETMQPFLNRDDVAYIQDTQKYLPQ